MSETQEWTLELSTSDISKLQKSDCKDLQLRLTSDFELTLSTGLLDTNWRGTSDPKEYCTTLSPSVFDIKKTEVVSVL